MKVLGVAAGGRRPSSAALAVDGEPVAAFREERLTLQEGDAGFPSLAIEECLRRGGLRPGGVDLVVLCESPEARLSRSLAGALGAYPSAGGAFARAMRDAAGRGFRLRGRVSRETGVDPARIAACPQHLALAAGAFLTSPFDEAAVLTIDEAGEWVCGAVFAGDVRAQAPLRALHAMPYPHSLGMARAAFARYLGEGARGDGREGDGEGLDAVIRPHPDGTHELDLSFFDFSDPEAPAVSGRFREAFGPPGPRMAARLRSLAADEALRLARKARELAPSGNLCLGGGLALDPDCVAMIAESGLFRDVFVPHDPGETGGALGAALHASRLEGGRAARRAPADAGRLGEDLDPAAALDVALRGVEGRDFSVASFPSEALLLARCARLLRDRRVVAWVQGRAETGPRPLGGRCILARADDPALARRAGRASAGPAACVVAREDAAAAFGGTPPSAQVYRWGQASVPVAAAALGPLGAVLRDDGRALCRVCAPEDDPLFHGLLRECGRLGGLSALLQAPLRGGGLPSADSALAALALFLRADVDALVLGDRVLEKPS